MAQCSPLQQNLWTHKSLIFIVHFTKTCITIGLTSSLQLGLKYGRTRDLLLSELLFVLYSTLCIKYYYEIVVDRLKCDVCGRRHFPSNYSFALLLYIQNQ